MEKVLKEYSELKINFGHFGYQSKLLWLFPRTQWRDSIIELMSKYRMYMQIFHAFHLAIKNVNILKIY